MKDHAEAAFLFDEGKSDKLLLVGWGVIYFLYFRFADSAGVGVLS